MITINKEELVNFLSYLLGHVESCYTNECKIMIERFLKEKEIKNENYN